MDRRERDHLRYLRNREERIAAQREYYKAHREEILARKRKQGGDTVRISRRQPRKIIDSRYYMRHRDEILEKKRLYYERRKQQQPTAGTTDT